MRLRAIVLLSLGGCLEPTEVKLELTTDICDLKRVTIYFDGQPEAPIASFDPKGICPRDLGTLVFVPSGRDEKFGIVVEATKAADGKCDPAQCAKASRTVSYVKHSTLELPIQLETSCINVGCKATETCFHGNCVDRDVACSVVNRLCALKDGGAPDVALDAPIDAPIDPSCGAGASGKIVPGTLLDHWSFDELVGPYADSQGMSPVTLAPGYTQVVPGKCGAAVGYPSMGSNLMPLGTAVATTGVGVVADLRVSSTNIAAFSLLSAGRTMPSGWRISGVPGPNNTYSLLFTVLAQSMAMGTAAAKTAIPSDGTWHRIEVIGWGSIVHFLVDNGTPESVALTSGMVPAGMLPLELTGAPAMIAIDNLWIYTGK